MAIEHINIPEDGLHEPKGVSLAASNRVYISDGAGSGDWSLVDADALQGTISNSVIADKLVVTDGSGGFKQAIAPATAFGSMNLNDNATVASVTAASDSTLNTDTDFTEVSLAFTFANLEGMTSGSNFLQVDEAGLYLIDFWANVKSSVATTKFSLKFVVNGTDFVPRGPKLTTSNAGVISNISANGLHSFVAGDQIKLFIAADKTCDITLEDLTFQVLIIKGA